MPELCTFQSLTTQFEFSADVSAYQRSIGLIQLATDYVLCFHGRDEGRHNALVIRSVRTVGSNRSPKLADEGMALSGHAHRQRTP